MEELGAMSKNNLIGITLEIRPIWSINFLSLHPLLADGAGVSGRCMQAPVRFFRPSVCLVWLCSGICLLCARLTFYLLAVHSVLLIELGSLLHNHTLIKFQNVLKPSKCRNSFVIVSGKASPQRWKFFLRLTDLNKCLNI